MDIFETQKDVVLRNLLWLTQPEWGIALGDLKKSLPTLKDSVIL